MKKFLSLSLAALLMSCQAVYAADLPLISKGVVNATNWYTSSGWSDGSWMGCEWEKNAINETPDGAGVTMTLSTMTGGVRPYKCGELQSMQVSSFGAYGAAIRTAAGTGLNTALFTYTGSPTHDEVDFEFLGKNPSTVQLNYYVGGVGGHETVINLGFDASAAVHAYSFQWGPHSISWYVDGKLVHQTKVGATMPSHQGRLYLSLWAGSSQENGWLGALAYKAPVSAMFGRVFATPCVAIDSTTPWCKP